MVNREGLWDGSNADTYDAKWKRMAEAGQNPHGEVDFVAQFGPTSVLDAGCGTGRVAIEFARRGVASAGVDINGQMLTEARAKAPELDWVHADLAVVDMGRAFDAVVLAGNIILFVDPDTQAATVAGAARHVADGGRMIAGFGLGRGVSAAAWEQWVVDAGLEIAARYSTWQGDPFAADSNYLVSVAQRS